ncbi:MAG: hypothetical protein ABI574_05505 [Burkholderiales bacterium]
MPAAPLPDDIRRFMLTSIPSVPYLEALLLLCSEPGRVFDTEELARRLYIPAAKADELLQALAAAGVAADSGQGVAYAPRDPALASLIERLRGLYAENLIGITNLIHDARSRTALQLADAFKLRRNR